MSKSDHIRAELLRNLRALTARSNGAKLSPESDGAGHFEDLALQVFRYQASYNPLFQRYLSLLGKQVRAITSLEQIPHLPVTLFKSHLVRTGQWQPEAIFTSSGTTGLSTSRHAVRHLDDYLFNARCGFTEQYGALEQYAVLALLPSYLERSGSSLVAMTHAFIQRTNQAFAEGVSGFYLDNHPALMQQLKRLQDNNIKTLLLGVTYALLDLAARPDLAEAVTRPDLLIVMETGGMKGKRKEMTRSEVHDILRRAFGVQQIHSEYGMTELFSQAYAPSQGLFYPASTMRVHATELNDPFALTKKTGLLNITDLANLDTCAFICTEDLGRVQPDGSFEVIGRADIAEMRGCNLMVE